MSRFSSHSRLSDGGDFLRLFKTGRRLRTPGFTVYVDASPAPNPRLGIAIAKRHVPRAVNRNRIKRVIREYFRLHHAALPMVDVIVQSTPQAASAANVVLSAALERVWREIPRLMSRPHP